MEGPHMRRPMVLALGLGLVAFALLVVSTVVYFRRPATLTVAVSPSDAEDFDLMGAAAKLLKRRHAGLRFNLVRTDGVAAAAAALDAGRADLAVVRADVAMPGKGETVVLTHKDAAVLLVPAGSEIARIEDLAGKRVGMLSSRPGDTRILLAELAQYDVAPEAVKTVPLNSPDVADAVTNKSVDAFFAVGPVSDGLLPETVKAVTKAGGGAPAFLPVAEAAAIAQRSADYESLEVVRGAFGGMPPRPADEFDTIAVTYRLVASTDLSENTVAALTRFLLSERVALSQIAPSASRMEAPSTDKGAPLPAHPGTAAYIDDDESSFLDKYSDFIYIGAMMLGVTASGLSALVGRLANTRSVRVDDLVARLMVIFKDVRAAESWAMLDGAEGEVDAIVSEALDETGLRNLEERRVAALNMAVEQVRSAIRDRRDSLRRATPIPANDRAPASTEAVKRGPAESLSSPGQEG